MADEEEACAKKEQSLMQCSVIKPIMLIIFLLSSSVVYILVHAKDPDRIVVVTLNEPMNLKMSITRLL